MSEKKFLDLTGLSTIISKILNQCSSIYSSKERVVGKWTDGKKLYEITIAATKISGTDLEIDVSSLSIDVGFVYGGFWDVKKELLMHWKDMNKEEYLQEQSWA